MLIIAQDGKGYFSSKQFGIRVAIGAARPKIVMSQTEADDKLIELFSAQSQDVVTAVFDEFKSNYDENTVFDFGEWTEEFAARQQALTGAMAQLPKGLTVEMAMSAAAKMRGFSIGTFLALLAAARAQDWVKFFTLLMELLAPKQAAPAAP